MVDVWPATLPQFFLVDGFAQGEGDGRLRSQTDTGPAKVRLRSSSMPSPLQGQMAMTTAQLEDMKSFVAAVGQGTLPFTFPEPVTRAMVLVRFGENKPRWVSRGPGDWTVSLDLEVLP